MSKEGTWIKGKPPLHRIVMIWNGTALFGPMSFMDDMDICNVYVHIADHPVKKMRGEVTHYLILPKAPAAEREEEMAFAR